MTIDEAIEVLEHGIAVGAVMPESDAHFAIKLGIETLRLVKELRASPYCPVHLDLPGEIEK